MAEKNENLKESINAGDPDRVLSSLLSFLPQSSSQSNLVTPLPPDQQPDIYHLNDALSLLRRTKSKSAFKQISSLIVKGIFAANEFTWTVMLAQAIDWRDLQEMGRILEWLNTHGDVIKPDDILYARLIQAAIELKDFATVRRLERALTHLEESKGKDIDPTVVTLLLKGYQEEAAITRSQEALNDVQRLQETILASTSSEIQRELRVAVLSNDVGQIETVLKKLSSYSNEEESALSEFRTHSFLVDISKATSVLVNDSENRTVASACIKAIVKMMDAELFFPNAWLITQLLKYFVGLNTERSLKYAEKIIRFVPFDEKAPSKSVQLDAALLNAVLDFFEAAHGSDIAVEIFESLSGRVSMNMITLRIAASLYQKVGNEGEVKKLREMITQGAADSVDIKKSDPENLRAAIQRENAQEIYSAIKDMIKKDMKPSVTSLIESIRVMEKRRGEPEVNKIIAAITRDVINGTLPSSSELFTKLVQVADSTEIVSKLFEAMDGQKIAPDTFTYNSAIHFFLKNGDGKKALQAARMMEKNGVPTNEYTQNFVERAQRLVDKERY